MVFSLRCPLPSTSSKGWNFSLTPSSSVFYPLKVPSVTSFSFALLVLALVAVDGRRPQRPCRSASGGIAGSYLAALR